MDIFSGVDTPLFNYLILPLLIFLARITDQTIGTIRLIYAAKGFKFLAPIVGFFESLIWLTAISQIMKHLDNVYCYVAFAGGFAVGNFLGIYLEQKISIGVVLVRIIMKEYDPVLGENLKAAGYGFTVMDAEGREGSVKLLFSTIHRKKLKKYIKLVHEVRPNAFYTVEDIRQVKGNVFEKTKRSSIFSRTNPLNRKGG
ncbi:MAG: hypothetical protein C0597_12340 [Marinilabiliales bacterium]|nr:MAG: hypothetical protein C0597_12340 [Marinilabiliales bacterium]